MTTQPEPSQSNLVTKFYDSSTMSSSGGMQIWQLILIGVLLVLLIVLSALFSGAEMAYSSMNPGTLEEKIKTKARGSTTIKRHINKFNMTLSTILIGNNVVNIAASALMSLFLGSLISDGVTVTIITTVLLTPIIVIFGEILPKIIAKSHPYGYLSVVTFFIDIWYWLFWPITWILSKIGKKGLVTNSEIELKNILDLAASEGVLEKNESMLANNALDFDSEKVSKHYTKMEDIDYIDYDAIVAQAKIIFKDTYFSRLPIKKDNNFIAILHLKDIFDVDDGETVFQFSKNVPLISSNANLNTALEKLRLSKSQMGFITKNNNTTKVIGLITIEDIIEEIVGEIYDEFDEEENITEISLQKFRIKGKTSIKDVARAIDVDIVLEEEESDKETFLDWLKKRIDVNVTRSLKYNYNEIFVVKVHNISKTKEHIFEITLL